MSKLTCLVLYILSSWTCINYFKHSIKTSPSKKRRFIVVLKKCSGPPGQTFCLKTIWWTDGHILLWTRLDYEKIWFLQIKNPLDVLHVRVQTLNPVQVFRVLFLSAEASTERHNKMSKYFINKGKGTPACKWNTRNEVQSQADGSIQHENLQQ